MSLQAKMERDVNEMLYKMVKEYVDDTLPDDWEWSLHPERGVVLEHDSGGCQVAIQDWVMLDSFLKEMRNFP